jgi:hypothetical protein
MTDIIIVSHSTKASLLIDPSIDYEFLLLELYHELANLCFQPHTNLQKNSRLQHWRAALVILSLFAVLCIEVS